MRPILTCFSFLVTLVLSAQSKESRKIVFERKKLISDVSTVTDSTVDEALKIAAYFLNSKEFRDTIVQMSYPEANNCVECGPKRKVKGSIAGRAILDNLLNNRTVPLTLRLYPVGKKPINVFGKKWCWSLGNTCPNTDSITSFYQNIICDMGDLLPFTYAYAVHLCHEYMHNIGYCHTDHALDNDIAESVGWIAFYYIKNWYDVGVFKWKMQE